MRSRSSSTPSTVAWWISDLRASAAIVYGRTPRIVVVMAYRPEITEAEARELGRRVAALTLG